MEYTHYRCNQCGAEDRDRTSNPPLALICHNWKCRAGKNTTSLAQQMDAREGMFQVDDKNQFPWERN